MPILEDTLLAEINELYNGPESDEHAHARDAARVNTTRRANGKALREAMPQKKMLPKPLPVHHFKLKQRRGGRRQRKMKERLRFAATHTRLVPFGIPEDSSPGYAMLGQARSIRLRDSIVHTNAKVAKKLKETHYSGVATTSGLDLTSAEALNISFASLQSGILLCNP